MAETVGLRGARGYAAALDAIARPTAAETTAQGLVDATSNIPQNTFAGGLVQGLAQGGNVATKAIQGKKRDRMTEYLLAQQEYESQRARQADEMAQQLATLKAGYESKQLVQDNIDLSLDAYQSTGDLSMLNETLSNQAAAPFRKLFEGQITDQGGVYQGITATPEGDLMPYGLRADGSRVYGQGIPVEQGYSQGYLTAKQAKDLDLLKAQAEVDATQALANQRNGVTTPAPAQSSPASAEVPRDAGLTQKPTPKLTEDQGKNVGYATRMQGAMQTLDSLETTKGFDPANLTETLLSKTPGVGNYAVSDNFQKYRQAQNEFLAGILRGDTGAAITQQEFELYGPMYFPQPGDGGQVRKQKAEARVRALAGTMARTGPGASMVGSADVSQTAPSPKVDFSSSPQAAQIKADFQAGKISREQARSQLQALGGQ